MSFAVVQFGDDDGGSVSIVNSLWLTPRRCEVFWPPVKGSKAFEKLLKANTTPDEKWQIYGVKRICETANTWDDVQISNCTVEYRDESITEINNDAAKLAEKPVTPGIHEVAANAWDDMQTSNCSVKYRDES